MHLISSSTADIDGVRLHRTDLYDVNPLRSLKNCLKVRKLIQRINPDIIHLFGLYSVNSLALLPCVYGLPNLVMTPWGTDVVYDFSEKEPFKSRFIKRFLLKRADRITSLSHFMAGHIDKYLSDSRCVDYVPWGADLDVFKNCNGRNNPELFTIGITKAFTAKYGHVHLLEAVSSLVHRYNQHDLKLVIIGRGELEGELKKRCLELKIDDYVDFKGFTSDPKALSEHLSCFDVYVMPSVYKSETLGVAAIEAAAMGIPVIASRIGGIPEVVRNNVTGFLVEPGDPQAIADALLLFLRFKELRIQMGRAGRQRVEKLYSFNHSVSKMNNCYKMMMEKQDRN